MDAVGSGLSVLVVCQANRYRSPLAEHLLAREFASRGIDWRVTSAGTAAAVGHPLTGQVRDLLEQSDVHPDQRWASRRTDRRLLEGVDLILTSDTARNAECTSLSPRSVRTVFTIRQFARLMAAAAHDGLDLSAVDGSLPLARRVLDVVRIVRGHLQPGLAEDNDIVDPVSRPATLLGPCRDLIARDAHAIADDVEKLGSSVLRPDSA